MGLFDSSFPFFGYNTPQPDESLQRKNAGPPSTNPPRSRSRRMNDDHHRKLEFAECLRRHQSQLFGYIHSLVRDLNDADDLFQQTTVILWNKFADFDQERSFIAWGCGVARLEIANFLRARGRQRLYFTDELNLM